MTNKETIINQFDPNSTGLKDANIYGLPFSNEDADVIIIPVPWEVTVSYGSGAAQGPIHVFEASFQVDLFHRQFPNLWKAGIGMDGISEEIQELSEKMRPLAEEIIELHEMGIDLNSHDHGQSLLAQVNDACEKMNHWVTERTLYWKSKGKKVALLGGDHSTPLGYYRALAKAQQPFGILHIDAHMDLRIAYEGFQYSHASVMYNAVQIPEVQKIVQVGIRDFCSQEHEVAQQHRDKIEVHFDFDMQSKAFEGTTWQQQCVHIISQLPEHFVISFDIDGLDPYLCPNTGTPVPGGLSFSQAIYLLNLAAQRKKLIGFDLVEVSPGADDWNGNVGARLLFHLCGLLHQAE